MAQVSYGTITITDTNDINRIYVEYCRSTSNQLSGTTVPNITRAWGETTPEWVDGEYIWQRAVIEKSGTLTKTYGKPVCLTGAQGETGDQGPQGPQGGTGAAGRSLTSTTTQYTTAATSATITQSNMGNYTWSNNVPDYNTNTPAYWVRITNTYSNPSSTQYIIYKDNGITDAVKTSHDANTTAAAANSTANTANQTANTANSTANSANTKADQAVTNVNNLQNKLKYYWVNEVAHTNGVSGWTKPNYPAGTYAASGISGTTFDAENSSTYGYNTWYANGINLRYNAIKLGELTGSALTFYQPSTTNQGAKAMELSGSALKFYASNGTTVQAEFGGSKARVSGTINAYDGQIGNSEDNYWYIGNYLDYFENQSAIIKSHGTASIQLGDSNTWRIATNRIHTAWNNDSSSGDAFKLHFPVYDNKYWDSGLHLPTSANDKLLYIRNSSSSNTLTYLNEALEDQYTNRWNYLFYITNSGSIYAKNIYVLDDNGQATQIGGTDGVYLLKSGGTITGNLTVNGTLTGTLSGTATRVSKDLKIQLNGGTTEGTNQFTYNGGTAKTINITKSSVGLSNVENTALSTWAGSSNLTTTKVGTLAAAAVKGVDTSITASSTSTNLPTSKAVADLIRGYLPLTGGNVTGAVTFGSSVSADELTAGDLVVNGSASFTNNLQANTINGVEVGASPKFTDTVTTVTTSGNGNAVTAITASNGKLTVTKGTTFLTSYTETDPIFVASAAHGITSNDISNWNSKTSNTGTVTSVRVQASSPLQSSVSTAQNASLNTTISFINQNANTVLAGPASGSTAAAPTFRKLVAADIPDISGTYYLANNPNGYTTNVGTVTKVIAGTGLAIGTTAQGNFTTSGTINHTNSVTAKTAAAQSAKTLTFGGTFTLYEEKYDAQGHITGVASYNMTMPANPDTHYTANLITGASATAKANAAASTNGNVYLNLVENSTVRNSHNIVGSGTVTVTSDADGKITISGSAHPTSLKNPNALAVKIYNGTSTSSNTNYDGSVANQSISVAGTNAITGINSTSDGKLQLTLADGSQPTPIAIKITATTSDSAASADKLNLSTNVGSSTRPVYFDANTGLPVAIDYTIQSNVPQNAKFTDTWTAMVGATSSANGSVGYVNAVPPKDGYNTKFLRADGTWVVPGGTYSLPLAANGTRGGVQIGYTQSGKNYPVQLSSEKMYVNVPWTDTTYSAGTGLSLSGTTFSNSGVTGVKGNAESSYRTGQVNLTAANVQAIKISENGNTQQLARPLQLNGCNDNTLDAKINTLRANRLAFLPADQIIIEKTTDGGTTWTDAGVVDSTKTGLFSETRAGVYIPLLNGVKDTNCGLRITFTAMKYNVPSGTAETSKYNYWNSNYIASTERYNQLKEMYFWVSSNTDSIGVKVERATGAASTNWVTIFDNTNYGLTGWSGNDYIRFRQGVFGGGTTQTGNYWNYRLTFFTRGPGGSMTLSGTNTNSSQSILEIRGYGDTLWIAGNGYAANDHLYTHDYLKNATFPAQVTATQFNGPLNGNASSATKATNDVDGNAIKTTYAKLSGATFTGAINTANGTYNKIGDDVQIGDINVAGTLGIKGINGRTGIRLVAYSGSTNTDIYNDGAGNLTITGTVLSTFSGNLTGNVTGNVTGTASGNITSVQYDSANTKFTYTKNGSNTDIVTIANLKTYLGLKALAYKDNLGKSDVGLGNVDNTADANKRVKGANITTTANAVAYYTDTAGTFGSKASANGVLYATAANGTLNWGTLPVAQGGTGATTAANARTNLGLGTAATYTAATSVGNNSNLPTGAAIQTYVTSAINGASNTYVTIATDQTITANQKTFNGAIRWGTSSKYGAAHYDSTLEAIVFSFA